MSWGELQNPDFLIEIMTSSTETNKPEEKTGVESKTVLSFIQRDKDVKAQKASE